MISTSILSQIGHGNQNPSTNAYGRRSPVGYQVIQTALADRQYLARLFAAYQLFRIGGNRDSYRWLLLRAVECLDRVCAPLSRIPFCSHPQL
jgi:hypothetical protein